MEFIDLAKKRYSLRKYSQQPIPREMIDSCLEVARLAPSACNSQPWFFLVVDNKELINTIAKRAASGIYSMNYFINEAPVLIAVITEKSKYTARFGGKIMDIKYNLIDIGIVCDHLVLQAAALGLGTCMLGWFNKKQIKKILKIDGSKNIDMLISLGYPRAEENKEKTRKPLADIRRYISGANQLKKKEL